MVCFSSPLIETLFLIMHITKAAENIPTCSFLEHCTPVKPLREVAEIKIPALT